ncbi:MAG: hypothetical protein ABMA26_12105 [Limisphaerales bacterium]
MKKTITITLDEYDARLLEAAIRTTRRPFSSGEEVDRSQRRYVLGWMLRSVAAAIIRQGNMPAPLAVELRHETEAETWQRLRKQLPRPSLPPLTGGGPPSWLN